MLFERSIGKDARFRTIVWRHVKFEEILDLGMRKILSNAGLFIQETFNIPKGVPEERSNKFSDEDQVDLGTKFRILC